MAFDTRVAVTESPYAMMLKTLILLVTTAHCEYHDDDVSCTLDDGSIGECVLSDLCDVEKDLIDPHYFESPCESYLDLCCPLSAKRSPNSTTPQLDPTVQRGCGWRNPKGVGLNTTSEFDDVTMFGEFPWMVALLEIKPVNAKEPDGPKHEVYKGAGSLIGLNMVLTAAHIIAKAKSLKIRAGEWDTQSTNEIYPYQDREVTSVETHESFSSVAGNLFFDVAILFFTRPIDLAPHVGVACLPSPEEVAVSSTRCYVTGWARHKRGNKDPNQNLLKKVELPVVEHDACQELLRKTPLGSHFKLHPSFMCAGGEKGPEICIGDGGSPLSCPIKAGTDRYTVNGLAAWRIGCGAEGNPGTYTDVAHFRRWIDEKAGSNRYTVNGLAAWRIGCGAEGNPGTYADVAHFRRWIDEKVTAHGYDTQSYTALPLTN